MNATLNPSRSFFSIAAWYAVFTPFVAAAAIGVGLAIGIPDRHSHAGSPADFLFGTAACILLSSALASIVSLFGIRRHGWRVIVWKSIVGLILCCLVYVGLAYVGMAEMCQQ